AKITLQFIVIFFNYSTKCLCCKNESISPSILFCFSKLLDKLSCRHQHQHTSVSSIPVVVLVVATTVPSCCICKIFIVCSSRAFNILEILANKHRQSSLLFEDQLPSPSSSPTFKKLTFLDLTKQGKNKRNDKMAAGGSGSGQPQFLLRLIYNLEHSTSMGWCHDIGREQVTNKSLLKTIFQVMMRLFSPHKTTLMFVIRDKTRIPLENLEPVLRGCT
uniref:Uncharacterized protein n=1 Tax=Cucumis melo TaxID=3656 RepID=A0A9I9EMM2_CUCME